MKKSTIMLLAGAGFLLLCMIAAIVSVRFQFDSFKSSHPDAVLDSGSSGGNELVVRDLPGGNHRTMSFGPGSEVALEYKDFDGLNFVGAWQLKLTQGQTFSVNIAAPGGGNYQIATSMRGTVLNLGLAGRTGMWNGPHAIATITLPVLHSIRSQGALDAEIDLIKTDNLELDLTGGNNMHFISGQIDNLKTDLNGGYQLQLSNAKIHDADINANGAGLIELFMDGGALSGQINGAVVLNYEGKVSGANVTTSGLSSVHKD